MTREEAQLECERLAAEHPDRARFRWFPRREPSGGWSVARVPMLERPRLTTSQAPPPPAPREEDPSVAAHRVHGWGGF